MCVIATLYGRVLIKRVSAGTECAKREEQCEFWHGSVFIDQEFAVRHVCEKYQTHGKDVFWAFMDMEYD